MFLHSAHPFITYFNNESLAFDAVGFNVNSLHILIEEEDATVWARYSLAYFEQSVGRQACNNPYDQVLETTLFQNMSRSGRTHIAYKEFLDVI